MGFFEVPGGIQDCWCAFFGLLLRYFLGLYKGVLQGVSHCLFGFLVIGWFFRIVGDVGSFVFLRGLWAVFDARYLVFLGLVGFWRFLCGNGVMGSFVLYVFVSGCYVCV